MAEEMSFYSDTSGIRITDKRLILKNTTYSLANITSVSTHVERPSKVGPVLTVAVGAFILVAGIANISSGGAFGVILGGFIVAIGVVWYKGCKPICHLRIASASGEQTPLKGSERWIGSIANAINEAIVHRA